MATIVSDYITSSNGELKPIKTGKVYGAVAPVRLGKTLFSLKTVHTALVKYGVDSLVWNAETDNEVTFAILRALHFNYMYEKLGYKPISEYAILNEEFPTEEYRELEERSKIDLFENPKHGYVRSIHSNLDLDTLKVRLIDHIEDVDPKLIVIDSLDLVDYHLVQENQKQTVLSAYNIVLDLAQEKDIAIVSPHQSPLEKDKYESLANRLNRPTFVELDLDEIQF
ncbi:hypothetical protein [Bacillus toyonensis]|uniref:hypothetical protein n=1 Tax=Bacillus toyonensis TaxID=155322 RepID=UPI000BF530DB|nr:hypothetical protein [Bacillus toyonensis]PGF05145.1 hypothetical protein COM61_01605 [Bacillus toyonensis]